MVGMVRVHVLEQRVEQLVLQDGIVEVTEQALERLVATSPLVEAASGSAARW